VLSIFTVLAVTSHAARSDEDDDDPKAGPPKVAPKHKVIPKVEAKPAPKPEPIFKPAPVAKMEPVFKEPGKKSEPDVKPKPALVAEPKTKSADKPKARAVEGERSDKPIARTPDGESIPAGAGAGRAVRVRLVDGSTVVGKVRAEREETLVVDCALGQLAIPRSRVSTINYDDSSKGRSDGPVDPFGR